MSGSNGQSRSVLFRTQVTPPETYVVIDRFPASVVVVDAAWVRSNHLGHIIPFALSYNDQLNDILSWLPPDQQSQLEQYLSRNHGFSPRIQPINGATLQTYDLTAFTFEPYYPADLPHGGTGSGTGLPPAPTQSVSGMSSVERIAELLRRALYKMGPALRNTLRFDYKELLGMAAILVAIQATPVGWGADTALLGLGFAMAGWGGLKAIGNLLYAVMLAEKATTDAQMDAAAELAAEGTVALGLNVIMGFLLHKSFKSKGAGGKEATPEPEPEPRRPEPEPEPEPEPRRPEPEPEPDDPPTVKINFPGKINLMYEKDGAYTNILNSNAGRTERLDIIGHGNKNVIQFKNAFSEKLYNANELGDLLLSGDNAFTRTRPNIRLISCETGSTPDGFAQQLANKLNVSVLAPSDTLWVDSNGQFSIGSKAVRNGEWREFFPQDIEK